VPGTVFPCLLPAAVTDTFALQMVRVMSFAAGTGAHSGSIGVRE